MPHGYTCEDGKGLESACFGLCNPGNLYPLYTDIPVYRYIVIGWMVGGGFDPVFSLGFVIKGRDVSVMGYCRSKDKPNNKLPRLA